jgi:hypothetical protein
MLASSQFPRAEESLGAASDLFPLAEEAPGRAVKLFPAAEWARMFTLDALPLAGAA